MQLLAWVASALVFASFFMKTLLPLRMLAIAGNLAFITYALTGIHFGVFDKVLPILVLHLALLPLNILRLRELQMDRPAGEAPLQSSTAKRAGPERRRVPSRPAGRQLGRVGRLRTERQRAVRRRTGPA